MPDEPTKLPADLDAWVEEVKERCDAATDGPWWSGSANSTRWLRFCSAPPFARLRDYGHDEYGCAVPDPHGNMDQDGDFIAHARADLPTALAIIADLRAKLAHPKHALQSNVVRQLEQRDAEIDRLRQQLRDLTTQTTNWHCEHCGRVRDGRGCVTCLTRRLAAAEAVCEAAGGVQRILEANEPHEIADYQDVYDALRSTLAAYDATKSKGVG